jgi:hypothetical protein
MGMDLRRIGHLERWLSMLLALLGFIGTVLIIRQTSSATVVNSFLAGGAFFFVVIFIAAIIPTIVAYFYTRFIIPLLLLISGTIMLLILNGLAITWPTFSSTGWSIWLLLITISLWSLAGLTYAAAGWRLHFPSELFPQGMEISEEIRLRHAFARFFEALFEGFRLAFGERRARAIDDDLDIISVTAGWQIEIDRGRVRDRLDLNRVAILEQANRYREVLNRAIDLMDNWTGRNFIIRAAQAAYDCLPWPERETLGRYVLTGTTWGGESRCNCEL